MISRRFFLILFLFVCTAFSCLAQEKTVIEPELQQLLNNAGSEKYSIIIVMKSQAEASAVKAKVAAHRDRGVQRTAVVNEFKAHSNASQISLLTFLRAEEQKGNVANVTPLWIANTVCCDATRDIIENQNNNARSIMDFLVQDKIATLQAENQGLRFAASQAAQNTYLLNELKQCPVPAYVVPNPYCCGGTYNYASNTNLC